MEDEKTLQKIKKIYALSQGKGEEADSAKAMLQKYLDKYDLTIHDIKGADLHEFIIKVRGKKFLTLIIQICFSIAGNKVEGCTYYEQGNGSYELKLKLTHAEHVDILESFDFHKKLYKEEEDILLNAFIMRHDLFSKEPRKREQKQDLSQDELEKMHRANKMAGGLHDETFDNTKKLNDGS